MRPIQIKSRFENRYRWIDRRPDGATFDSGSFELFHSERKDKSGESWIYVVLVVFKRGQRLAYNCGRVNNLHCNVKWRIVPCGEHNAIVMNVTEPFLLKSLPDGVLEVCKPNGMVVIDACARCRELAKLVSDCDRLDCPDWGTFYRTMPAVAINTDYQEERNARESYRIEGA